MEQFSEINKEIAKKITNRSNEVESLIQTIEGCVDIFLDIEHMGLDDAERLENSRYLRKAFESSLQLARKCDTYMIDFHIINHHLKTLCDTFIPEFSFSEKEINSLLSCKLMLHYWDGIKGDIIFSTLPIDFFRDSSQFLDITISEPKTFYKDSVAIDRDSITKLMNGLKSALIRKAHTDLLPIVIDKKASTPYLKMRFQLFQKFKQTLNHAFPSNADFFSPPEKNNHGAEGIIKEMGFAKLNTNRPFAKDFAILPVGLQADALLTLDKLIDSENNCIKHSMRDDYLCSDEQTRQLVSLARIAGFRNLTPEQVVELDGFAEMISLDSAQIKRAILDEIDKIDVEYHPDYIQAAFNVDSKSSYKSLEQALSM